jgi:8-oxo-dGTP diphosphatase
MERATIRLCSGLLERDGAVLLVASRYPNQPAPLWNLPGGRQRRGELLSDTLVREWREETGLAIDAGALLYVSESYDRASGSHVVNVTFAVRADGVPQIPRDDAHVVDLAWVPRADIAHFIAVRVVREPLLAHFTGDARRYYGYRDAGIAIAFSDEP